MQHITHSLNVISFKGLCWHRRMFSLCICTDSSTSKFGVITAFLWIFLSTIVLGQSVADGDSLTSSGGTFELGFFTPGSSPHRYVGIWFKKIPVRKVVWVANRLNPVVGSSGVLQIGEDGNLVNMDGQNLTWSTGVSSVSNGSIVELLDSGNLVLRGGDSNGSFIWQGFVDLGKLCFGPNWAQKLKFGP
ncbi:hypothetical protein PVL29_025480 [Vitis rotundifolia]|uniref:Bulb-type lectin domain-containing protein n=1 Tax=Vitis rotundifolia TaxID=103349 RepID=A0AA38YJU6_VITRO|nr:hypothetical protein PVL29_025480 [Vitis rotundifolia]